MYAGIDTHADTHHVAVIDTHGRPVDDLRVEATARGYREVVRFLAQWVGVALVGWSAPAATAPVSPEP